MPIRRTATRSAAPGLAAGEARELSSCVAGIPFLLAAATPGVAFQPAAVLAGFVLSVLAFFTVQLPIAATLLAPPAGRDAEFALSRQIYLALLAVWTLTVWLASAANA